jgi:hypothetical protein
MGRVLFDACWKGWHEICPGVDDPECCECTCECHGKKEEK